MNKKKLVSLCLVLALLITAAVGATFAYFTDNDEATNVFTVGNVNIELLEPAWNEPETVEPGIKYDKDPYVENIGATDAWVRMDVIVSDAEAFTRAMAKHQLTDLGKVFGGYSEDWKCVERKVVDGNLVYTYYHKNLVPAQTATKPLFTSVTLPAVFDNEDMASLGEDFTITVKAHAIQDADDFENDVNKAFQSYAEQTPVPNN